MSEEGMSAELEPDESPTGASEEAPAAEVTTGVPAVDAALAEVEQASGLPLEEQLAVFERAHRSLRVALDDDPGEPG